MNTKLIAALVIVGVLAITVVGLVSAQIATSNPNGTTNAASNNGVFGWIGRCFGFGGTTYSGTGTSTYQGTPANSGYGPCMRGVIP